MDFPDGELGLGPSGEVEPGGPERPPTDGRQHTMEQALQQGRPGAIDEMLATCGAHEEDDLGFAVGLRFAVPIGLALWVLVIWAALRFFG